MKLAIGLVIGVLYLVLTGLAWLRAADGWRADHPDLGFWWAVIGTFLLIAGGAAMVGTWIHTRGRENG